MKIYIDTSSIKTMIETERNKGSLADSLANAGILHDHDELEIAFCWPSFLEHIGLGSLFEDFPKFGEQNHLFNYLITTLAVDSDKDLVIRLYDQVFVESLTQIKALSQIHPKFLLEQIQSKRRSLNNPKGIFYSALDRYEKLLVENTHNIIHDLTLYLAWDRVCVNLAIIFDHIHPEIKNSKGFAILKECLLESFQHITAQGRTVPGFFRLVEALYAYQMREENLERHTDSEWKILCQSVSALRPREALLDLFYIDAAIVDSQKLENLHSKEKIKVITMDSPDRVNASLSLVRYMLEKIKSEELSWEYSLYPAEIIYFNEKENSFVIINSTS